MSGSYILLYCSLEWLYVTRDVLSIITSTLSSDCCGNLNDILTGNQLYKTEPTSKKSIKEPIPFGRINNLFDIGFKKKKKDYNAYILWLEEFNSFVSTRSI